MREQAPAAPRPAAQARNGRRLVPPRDKARRRRFYALVGKAKKVASAAQRQHLLQLARSLMVWVEADHRPAETPISSRPPATADGRPRPRRRVGTP